MMQSNLRTLWTRYGGRVPSKADDRQALTLIYNHPAITRTDCILMLARLYGIPPTRARIALDNLTTSGDIDCQDRKCQATAQGILRMAAA